MVNKQIAIVLRQADGKELERTVDIMAVQDVGVIYDEQTSKHYIFAKLGGNFYSKPIFEETKILNVDVGREERLRVIEKVLSLPSAGHASASELADTILDALEKVQ